LVILRLKTFGYLKVLKSHNSPIAQSPNGKIWLSESQGLRGLDPGVVWRRKTSLPHWKPGPG
jgi:hypothetical protein